MRKFIILVLTFLPLCSISALARDTTHYFSIADAMATQDFKNKLNGSIRFFFSSQQYPAPKATMGEYTTSKKTNAFNKSDEGACQWALLSALIALQERAVQEGGNAVVDIVSNYKHNEYSSPDKYECHAGGLMAGVALKARVVTLP